MLPFAPARWQQDPPGAHSPVNHLRYCPLPSSHNHGPVQRTVDQRLRPQQETAPSRPPFQAQPFSSLVPTPSQHAYQESLLRRKTPSGTLPAAYDAAPVDWTARPTKHILLPVPPLNGQQAPEDPHRQIPRTIGWDKAPHMASENLAGLQGADIGVGTGSIPPTIWAVQPTGKILPENSLDLYTRFALQHNQSGQRNPETMLLAGRPSGFQPLYNSIMSPTASCEDPNGFYFGGAYNPVPRDSNWYGHYGNWGSGHTTLTQLPQAPQKPLYQMNTMYAPPAPHFNPSPIWAQSLHRADSVPVSTFPQNIILPFSVNQQTAMATDSHIFDPHGYPSGAVPSIGPQSFHDPHLKDTILAWAHGVYVDLLATMQAQQRQGEPGSKSTSSNRVHSTSMKNSLYPRPPQPNVNGWKANGFRSHVSLSNQFTAQTPRSSLERVSQADDNDERRKRLRSSSLINSKHPEIGTSSSNSLKLYDGDGYPFLNRETTNFQGNHGKQRLPHNVNSQWRMDDQKMENKDPPMDCYSATTPLHRLLNGASNNSLGPSNTVFPSTSNFIYEQTSSVSTPAVTALEALHKLCEESGWTWLDGMLLGGCLAYGLGDLNRAMSWYFRILEIDEGHVEALSNLAATLLSLNRRGEAEQYWLRAVKKRPSYFEAVEHLVGLLCGEQRGKEAVEIINFVELSLRLPEKYGQRNPSLSSSSSESSSASAPDRSSPDVKFDYETLDEDPARNQFEMQCNNLAYGLSGFMIPGSDNGRMLALIHAKGNMLYTLGDNAGAARAFEDAVLIGAGYQRGGIKGLINRILAILRSAVEGVNIPTGSKFSRNLSDTPVLLPPDKAVQTARLIFPPNGELPGLREVPSGSLKKAAISTTSNSLLSLAKIFQDGMSSGCDGARSTQAPSGVKDILALYYLSLSLHPSPSTANNVGILLASVQQTAPIPNLQAFSLPQAPGVGPGSGISLALAYYHYGLNLDSRHAHLYTNLGSLLKDINQLGPAIRMYEQAVACDGTFDIALANLANAVKDQGKISDAIGYYRRAVKASPDFAEAVCGLANALNSVCEWKGRGGIVKDGGNRDRWHVDDNAMLVDAKGPTTVSSGWMKKVVDIVEKQLADGENWGKGVVIGDVAETLLREVENADGSGWSEERRQELRKAVEEWTGKPFEGAKVIRMIERASRRTVWRWYQEKYVKGIQRPEEEYRRPTVPPGLTTPNAPTVLPFHTFTCPLSAKQVRMISQRNGLRISCSTLRAPWLPPHVYPPPAPPTPYLKVGYVSSDFNNHPLAHLMQSVFGLHDPSRVKAYCYATTASDGSVHRKQIEREAPCFYDAHSWGPDRLVKQIVDDGIHILINLNGFTRGARNEIFAARPAPIQMSFMGFAGTLGAEWCDYLYSDTTAIPPETLRPWRRNVDIEDEEHGIQAKGDNENWVYSENIIFARYSFFCCDHRQSAPDSDSRQLTWEEEQKRRWAMRKELFPKLPSNYVILGNFNQLYKIEPTTFRTWLRILSQVPKAILWLLRFPELGESNLKSLAAAWAGSEVASRIIFTDVAPKAQHISRAQVCDVFLDTPECNAHTTAADVLWSGTPLLTLPRHKHKMCSRIAASIIRAAVPQTPEGKAMGNSLIADNEESYEARAVELAQGMVYDNDEGRGVGELHDIRKVLFMHRWESALFDTKRWVRDLEDAYDEAWRKWVNAEGGDIFLKEVEKSY